MVSRWYIVNALSNYENKAADMIRDQVEKKGLADRVEQVVVPIQKAVEIRRGKKVAVDKKIFPGYILVKMELDDMVWNLIENIPRVSGFLGGGKPVAIPQKEVDRMLKQVEEGAVVADVEIEFSIGETVKIIVGPFETFSALIDEVDAEKKKLKVSVSIFGRQTPVELEYNQVEKIND